MLKEVAIFIHCQAQDSIQRSFDQQLFLYIKCFVWPIKMFSQTFIDCDHLKLDVAVVDAVVLNLLLTFFRLLLVQTFLAQIRQHKVNLNLIRCVFAEVFLLNHDFALDPLFSDSLDFI